MNDTTGTAHSRDPTIPAIMFIFGVVGNVIAVVVLRKTRKEQKETTFYTLVCGLAVTDLLGTLLASPVTIATYMKGRWPGGDPLCQYSGFVLLFFSLAGLSFTCTMSVERYLAINHAYLYSRYVDQRLAAFAIAAIYVTNVLFCALPSMGLGSVVRQFPGSWCFIDWRTNASAHAAFSYMYAGVSSALVLVTVACNVLVCGALIMMHRRFVRRTSLGTDGARVHAELRRRRSFARMAGAEIQMVIVLIATSAVVLICSIPLVVRVFVNQLYRYPEMKVVEGNPDLQAIRIASVNAILDPWIYILLRKTVLQKVLEKVKCLFCRMGGRSHGPGHGEFRCGGGTHMSTVISRDSPTLVAQELRDVVSTSQTYLYPPDVVEKNGGSICIPRTYPCPTEQTLLQDPQGSESVNGQSSAGKTERTDMEAEKQGTQTVVCTQVSKSSQSCKQQILQVTFTDETLNLQERCI
ncbi:prostaglandin E2 receptor EP4 subtype [Astyanax mexicanus]|uniref:Prostaglandin E2 receptor EP4 subtype n=1 Tax=Astyanax mexicanus TaxID=7994 RepID=A0A8B9JAP0_ASTMX|nr:prostaglandin E2 receptor EP4 subtype [Astyanax mexicanus]